MLDWPQLEATCRACTRCGLCETRHNVVFGVGPRNADVMFVGEGPGQQEDLQGEPFVGPAGQLLDDMLCIIDLGRHNCYIANIVKCRPPKNRDPMEIEQDACIDYLRNQVALIRPKIIVCLGRIAALRLIRSDFRITREHGQWVEKRGVWMTAIYHPSAGTPANVPKPSGTSKAFNKRSGSSRQILLIQWEHPCNVFLS